MVPGPTAFVLHFTTRSHGSVAGPHDLGTAGSPGEQPFVLVGSSRVLPQSVGLAGSVEVAGARDDEVTLPGDRERPLDL